jgi:hypothetical protein
MVVHFHEPILRVKRRNGGIGWESVRPCAKHGPQTRQGWARNSNRDLTMFRRFHRIYFQDFGWSFRCLLPT